MNLKATERIILAFDQSVVTDRELDLIDSLSPYLGAVKIGLETMSAPGSRQRDRTLALEMLDFLHKRNIKCMWDGKFDDISNTVGAAVRNTADRDVWGMTVMAGAGEASLRAAVQNCGRSILIGVTVLTSIDADECLEDHNRYPEEQVEHYAKKLVRAKAPAIVCSPLELRRIRNNAETSNLTCITPGIRGSGVVADDQSRTMSAGDAIKTGAEYLVIGRPIMKAKNPLDATIQLCDEIETALSNRTEV